MSTAEKQAQPSAPVQQCALCWNKARTGIICDACRRSMNPTGEPKQ